MICLSCPHCGTALEFADDLEGTNTACYACRQPIQVPAAPPRSGPAVEPGAPSVPWPPPPATGAPPAGAPPAGAPPAAGAPLDDRWRENGAPGRPAARGYGRPPQSSGFRGGLMLPLGLVALVITLGIAGLMLSGGDVWIYVDNGGTEPLVVAIDGKDEATIGPGQFDKVKCPPGLRKLQVRSGDRVVYDAVKDLPKPDKIATNRRYLFNPDNHNRYRTYLVTYGSSPFEGLGKFLPKDLPVEDREGKLRDAYQKLLKEVELLPPDAWFEVPESAMVLTREPDSVVSKSSKETRRVLARVDPKDYATLAAARDHPNPTEADLMSLAEVVERVLETKP